MPARILTANPRNLEIAAQALRKGELVAMPTETVYGLAADASNPEAVARIFEVKERPVFDPLIVHVSWANLPDDPLAALTRLGLLAPTPGEKLLAIAKTLIARFWPGPLTLVLPKGPDVPDLVTSGLSTVAIRMPAHPVAQTLIERVGRPLAAPSANRFGRVSPTTAQAVFEELGNRISWIVDGGACEVGVESTVLAVSPEGELTLLRPGGVSAREIEQACRARVRTSADDGAQPSAPGMLKSHYAPETTLRLLPHGAFRHTPPELQNEKLEGAMGVLLFSGNENETKSRLERGLHRPIIARSLSPTGDPAQAARALFRLLRELDSSEARIIYAEECPTNEGISHAINDRLRRASAKRD